MKTKTQKAPESKIDQAKVDVAVAAGEIKIYPKPLPKSETSLAGVVTDSKSHEITKQKKSPKKAEKTSVPAVKLGQKFQVESPSSGTLVLNSDYVTSLELKKGDKVTVDGQDRTISAVTVFEKKGRAQIATAGCGKWPIGSVEISFNRA